MTRDRSLVNIYFDGENVGSSSEFCSNSIATDSSAAMEDHSVSIGHFARGGHGFGINNPGGPQASNRLQQADVSLFRLCEVASLPTLGTCLLDESCTDESCTDEPCMDGSWARPGLTVAALRS